MSIANPDHDATAQSGSATITANILWDQNAINAVLPAWQTLAATTHPCNFFLRPEAWQSWKRQLSDGRPSGLIVAYQGPRLVGVMPVMIRRVFRGPTLGMRYDYDPQDRRWLTEPAQRWIPLRQLSPVLSLPATMLGPVLLAAQPHKQAVIAAMTRAISQQRGWDMAVLPLEQGDLCQWENAFGNIGLHSTQQSLDRPGVGLKNVVSFDQLITRLNAKARQNHRRAVAAAAKSGITFSIEQDAPRTMAILRDLAAQSWKSKPRAGQHTHIPFEGLQGAFFDDLMLGADKDRIICAVATQNGTPIAIVLSVVTGRTLTTLLTYWNGAQSTASPGVLTLGTLINWAAQNRIDQIDYNSNSPWLKGVSDHSEMQQNLLVFAPGIRGRALVSLRQFGLALKELILRFKTRNSNKAAPK